MEQTIIHAVLSGDPKAIFGACAALVLTMFSAKLALWLVGLLGTAADKLHAWWDPLTAGVFQGRLQMIGDSFIDKIRNALSNQTHLNASVATAIADGTVSDDEWTKLAAAAFEDVKDNLGVHEWADLALLVTGSSRSPRSLKVEAAVKARFMASARAVASEVAEQKVTAREMRQRDMAMGRAAVAREFPAVNLSRAFTNNSAILVAAPAVDAGNS